MRITFDELSEWRGCILLDGAFDPLHAGHVRYLSDARKAFPECQFLVTIASDADVAAKGRPACLPADVRASVVEALIGVDAVLVKDRPTEDIITALKPSAYIKGSDWLNRLPAEQLAACALAETQIVYLNTVTNSSTKYLERWSLAAADRALDRLETFAAAQSAPTFDQNYFVGEWRGDAPFTYESRKRIEGRHPKIVQECFDGLTVLDVGCGPGHFVRMLRELGMDAGGIDPSPDAVEMSNGIKDRVVRGNVSDLPPKIAHVAICREVLEHVPVLEIAPLIADLFRVARKYVYITTRFTDRGVFEAVTDFETDPTHISLLSQPFIRALCVMEGGKRRRDLEQRLDWQGKGRVLVYEV